MDGLTPAPAPTPTGDVREKRKTSYGELRGADAVIALWFSETYGSSFFVARHAMRELTKRLTAAGFTIRPEAGTVTIPQDIPGETITVDWAEETVAIPQTQWEIILDAADEYRNDLAARIPGMILQSEQVVEQQYLDRLNAAIEAAAAPDTGEDGADS